MRPGNPVLGDSLPLRAMPGGFAGAWEPNMLIFQPQGVNNVPISSGRSTDVSSLRGRRKTKRLFNIWQRGILHALLPSSYCCNVVCLTDVNLGQEKFFSAF